MKKLRFLIADDETLTAKVLKNQVSKYGDCDQASNGREALEAFRLAFDGGRPYDMIFLDIMMPEMDGQSTLKAIREIEASQRHGRKTLCKIYMVTASHEPHDVLEAYKNQCDGFLTKPLMKQRIDDAVQELNVN